MTAVAIDGPAGAGKSSVARVVASKLGWRYVDTGAMYRAVALAAIQRGIDVDDHDALAALARDIELHVDDDTVVLEDEDVTERIRGRDVTAVVPAISALPAVRQALVEKQRALGRSGHVVMEGRDIATAVLPLAATKIFLTATIEERARRRAAQLGLPLDEPTIQSLKESIAARDEADSSRSASPLTRVPDARVVDTTDMTFEQVVELVCDIVAEADGS